MKFFTSDFGPQLPQSNLFGDGFLNVSLFRKILQQERSDSYKSYNQIIKEIFSNKEVNLCESADTAAVE